MKNQNVIKTLDMNFDNIASFISWMMIQHDFDFEYMILRTNSDKREYFQVQLSTLKEQNETFMIFKNITVIKDLQK